MTSLVKNNSKIWLSSPHMGGLEINYINQAFETNWVSPAGPNLDAFEKELVEYNDASNCAALSSGTAAIHLALIILGVKTGDEVLCSTFTFAGTCNPIVYLGATPVFIDSEQDSWNMDPAVLRTAIEDRVRKGKLPKAIIPVHLYGMPARIDEIMEIAREYNIPVVEDAAEGLGSTYKGKKLGTFGNIGIYSFNGNKIITTSGGGAMVSRNSEWIQKAKFLSTQARDQAPHYQHSQIGYNYRLSNVCAGIGRGQLKVLDQRVQQRREVYEFYRNELSEFKGLSFQPQPENCFSNRWLTCIVLNEQSGLEPSDIRISLEKENIESRPLWKPMHLQPVFKDVPYYGANVSEELFNKGLCLPSGSNLSRQELERVVNSIKEVFYNSSSSGKNRSASY
jgi:dTDP-4-amino-4,6-dideoxygalactose transaminase